jgi:HEAT repeat protein
VLTLEKLIKNSKEELLRGQAAITLARINPDNEIALKTLDSLIQKSQNAWIRWHVAKCLGELFPYHKLAIETLKNLAQTIRVDSVRLSMAQDLWKIDPSNSITASVLVELIRSTQDDFTRSIAISYLAKIDCSKTTALLEELAQSVQYEFIRWRVTHELSILAPENDLVQPILEELAQSAKTSRTRYYAADSLLDLSPGNKPAIKTLIELVKSSKRANDDIDTQTTDYFLADASDNAADRLIKSLKTINISDVVTSLRSCLTDEILENNSEKFIRCHSIIGRCAQNMSYPKFYQAWRSSSSTVDATK